MPRSRALLAIVPLLLGLLGCSLSGQSCAGDQPIDTLSLTPEVADVTPVSLDLCTLLTAAEIPGALGEAVEVQPGLQTGTCTFGTAASSQPKSAAVTAAQGTRAREFLQLSASLGLLFGQDPTALQTADCHG